MARASPVLLTSAALSCRFHLDVVSVYNLLIRESYDVRGLVRRAESQGVAIGM